MAVRKDSSNSGIKLNVQCHIANSLINELGVEAAAKLKAKVADSYKGQHQETVQKLVDGICKNVRVLPTFEEITLKFGVEIPRETAKRMIQEFTDDAKLVAEAAEQATKQRVRAEVIKEMQEAVAADTEVKKNLTEIVGSINDEQRAFLMELLHGFNHTCSCEHQCEVPQKD